MNAQVFHLDTNNQEQLSKSTTKLLETSLPGIKVHSVVISKKYSKHSTDKEHEDAESYLRLLKASMITVADADFDVVVTGDSPISWCYMGRSHAQDKSGVVYALTVRHEDMARLFPAVAIMDRMVLVPKAMDSSDLHTDTSRFPWLFRPFDLRGVLLVDFEDNASLRPAIQEAVARVKAEIARFCCRQMLTREISQPDFNELSRLLSVSEEFLERHSSEFILPAAQLRPVIVSAPATAERPSRVTIEIQNGLDIGLQGVLVEIRAPSRALENAVKRASANSIRWALDLPAKGGKSIDFEIRPATCPCCPLEVSIYVGETIMGRTEGTNQVISDRTPPIASVIPLLLEVAPAA
jgi:hypothetical protein